MSKYVPTTKQVRLSAADMYANRVSRPAFDRWLAAHDREVKAEAWEKGVSAVLEAHRWNNAEPWAHLQDNPYRIESQETP